MAWYGVLEVFGCCFGYMVGWLLGGCGFAGFDCLCWFGCLGLWVDLVLFVCFVAVLWLFVGLSCLLWLFVVMV